jgi:hypothetical protein
MPSSVNEHFCTLRGVSARVIPIVAAKPMRENCTYVLGLIRWGFPTRDAPDHGGFSNNTLSLCGCLCDVKARSATASTVCNRHS